MEYGTRLREIRKAKGFSMYKLHKESGLSQGHISDLEKCINQPTIETLQKLLTPMGVTLAEFFNERSSLFIFSFFDVRHTFFYLYYHYISILIERSQ